MKKEWYRLCVFGAYAFYTPKAQLSNCEGMQEN